MFSAVMGSPYRFLIAAAVLAAILCLFPARVNEPAEEQTPLAQQDTPQPASGVPAGADLSERTQEGCMIHRTITYAPCGHSVQRREALPARLVGLTRTALQKEIASVIPGAQVTGFSGAEVDAAQSLDIPCPLHWMLAAGEDGLLCVMQNLSGEEMQTVRQTDIPLSRAPQEQRQELLGGMVFDDVQAMEGYLENLSS